MTFHPVPRGRWVLVATIVLGLTGNLTPAADARSAHPLPNCVVLPSDELPQQAPAETQLAPEVLRTPATERELRELARVLGREKEDTPARLLSAQRLPSPSIARIGVLVGDARAIMAANDAREALKHIETVPGIPAQTREWMEAQVAAIQKCAADRFEGRGGGQALMRTAELVEKLREELGPAVYRALRRPVRPPRPKGGVR